jgi:hypothetical protein
MAITALSTRNKQRKLEDELRTSLIKYMIEELGFPSSSILKEKSLSSLSCLLPGPAQKLPLRRVDIAVTTPCKEQGLRLLLIVECKLDLFFESALSQIQGYNHHLLAPFVWIASEKRSCVLSWKQIEKQVGTNTGTQIFGEYVPFKKIPTYAHLVEFSGDLEGGSS